MIRIIRRYAKMETEYELMRSERRSFNCPNRLWKELNKQTHGCFSVSHYIRTAIIEKMKRDNSNMDDYFDLLIEKEIKN